MSWWVLRGVLRQIGIDSRSGYSSQRRMSSRQWVQSKAPRPVKAFLYIDEMVTGLGKRAALHTWKTVSRGARNGVREGVARHGEHLELKEIRREFPKGTTYEQELRHRHRLARKERRDALRAGTVTPREEVVASVSRSADADSGPRSYFVKHRGDVYPSNSKVAAEAFAEQLRKAGFSGVTVGSVPAVSNAGRGESSPPPARNSQSDPPKKAPNDSVATAANITGTGRAHNNKGAKKNMSASTGDIVTVQGLQQAYERIKVFATQVMDQESAAAATYQQLAASYRSQAAALEAAAGQMQSVEMDNETVNDISNTAAALLAAADLAEQNAQRATEMVSASEAVSSTAAASGQRLGKHNAMREAVNSGQTARDTRVYQDQ